MSVVRSEPAKYAAAIVDFLAGEIRKSFLAPESLSLTINRFEQNATVTQLTAKSDVMSSAPTIPLISFSGTPNPSGSAEAKDSLYTLARNVTYKTRRMTGVINDVKNIPLSLKNIFMFRFVSAKKVFIVRLLRVSCP